MEIEKKFFVKQMPQNIEKYSKKEIEQGYLLLEDPVLRVRKSNDNYLLTYKSIKGIPQDMMDIALSAQEVELPISKEAYYHLLNKVDYNIIKKTRYIIPLDNNLIAELDIFHDKLEGLIIVEVEFPDKNRAKDFISPDWFGQEVTFDNRFRNNYLVKVNNLINDFPELNL